MANLGLQNNNPGNLRDPATGSFRTFSTVDEGNQALMNDIQIKQSGKSDVIKPGASLSQFASVWAPASDNNDPIAYANTLAQHTGTTVDTPFDQIPPQKLADAIKVAEGTSTPATSTKQSAPTDRNSIIKANVLKLQNANATLEDIEAYVKMASQESNTTTQPTVNAPQPNPSFTGLNINGMPNTGVEGSTQAIPNENTPSTVEALGNGGKGLISGTIESGNDIAAAIGGNTMMGPFNKLAESDQNYLTTIIGLRNKAAQAGNADEVSHFQNLIKNYKTTDNQSATDLFPALNKSTEQVLGDFASMGLETVGGLDAAAGGEQEGATLGNRLIEGAKTGGAYGSGFGAAGAMQNNEDAAGIAKSTAVGGLTGAATGSVLNGVLGKGPSEDIDKITENIAPKETAAEARLAMKEGRMTGATEPGIFTSGNPGEIEPAAKVQQAAQTINEQIPGAANMDRPTLFNALDDKIGTISQDLRPKMEAVEIPQESIDKLNNDWKELQTKQLYEADADQEANVAKIQKKFTTRIANMDTNNLADVWDERIDYDNSIPANVKKANINSPVSLQNQKTIWLQNRSLLNNIINDTSTGLGETSQKAFSNMTDMYTAQNGLLTNAKESIKAKPSKLIQWIKKNPIKATAIGIGAGAAVGSKIGTVGKAIQAVGGV